MTEEIKGKSPDMQHDRVLEVHIQDDHVHLWIKPPGGDPDDGTGWQIVIERSDSDRLAEILRPAPPAGSGGPVRIPPSKKKPPPRSNF